MEFYALGEAIQIDTLRDQHRARLETRLWADYDAAGRDHVEAVQLAADILSAYRERNGDGAKSEEILGLSSLLTLREAGERLENARAALIDAGCSIDEEEIEVVYGEA